MKVYYLLFSKLSSHGMLGYFYSFRGVTNLLTSSCHLLLIMMFYVFSVKEFGSFYGRPILHNVYLNNVI